MKGLFKVVLFVFVATLVVVFAGCGKSSTSAQSGSGPDSSQEVAVSSEVETSSMSDEDAAAAALKGMIDTYEGGDEETATKYMTKGALNQNLQIAYDTYKTPLDVWKAYRTGYSQYKNKQGLWDNVKVTRFPGYNQVKVFGKTARIPLVEKFPDGSVRRFTFIPRAHFIFKLVKRDGVWLVNMVEIRELMPD